MRSGSPCSTLTTFALTRQSASNRRRGCFSHEAASDSMTANLLILPGDGIGPEVMGEAERVLSALRDRHGLDAKWERALIGGAAYDATGEPLPKDTLERARQADAVLLAAVGGPKYDAAPREKRPAHG